jgi:hypothetical protein
MMKWQREDKERQKGVKKVLPDNQQRADVMWANGSLEDLMDELSRKTRNRGLTENELEKILNSRR